MTAMGEKSCGECYWQNDPEHMMNYVCRKCNAAAMMHLGVHSYWLARKKPRPEVEP